MAATRPRRRPREWSPRPGPPLQQIGRGFAAAILAEEGRFDGPTPPLTAAQAMDFDEVAALAAELTGRTIKRVTVSDEEFRQQMVSYGAPRWQADMMVDIFAAERAGEFATVDPTLAELIGREPIGFDTVLREALSVS